MQRIVILVVVFSVVALAPVSAESMDPCYELYDGSHQGGPVATGGTGDRHDPKNNTYDFYAEYRSGSYNFRYGIFLNPDPCIGN